MQYILSHIILKSMLFKDTVLLNNLASYVPHRELTLFTVLYIVVVVVFFGTVGAYMPLIERGVYLRRRDSIHHFHIDHNAPYLPPPPPNFASSLFPISPGYCSRSKRNRRRWLCKILRGRQGASWSM